MELKEFFNKNPKIALAFSGGTDSAYLLYMGKKYAKEIRAYYVKSQFQPQFELDDAVRLARELEVPLAVIEMDILSCSEVAENPENRCYYCKMEIFNGIIKRVRVDGFDTVIDGTNASDQYDQRPGMKALTQLRVLSPLRECGVTKSQVRELSKAAGLFTWNKASYACLATRIPAETSIDSEKLMKIEKAEDALFRMGFTDFRIRWFYGTARIQLPGEQFSKAAQLHEEVYTRLQEYFSDIFLDLKER